MLNLLSAQNRIDCVYEEGYEDCVYTLRFIVHDVFLRRVKHTFSSFHHNLYTGGGPGYYPI